MAGLVRLFAVCAIALLVLSPSVDALFCRDASAAAQGATVIADQGIRVAAHREGSKRATPAGTCLTCHCHFGATYLPPADTACAEPAASSGFRHAWLEATLPSAAPRFELERPPRA